MRHRLLSVLTGLLAVVAVSTEARAQTGIGEVASTISNIYGTFQAAQFVVSLFTAGSSTSVGTAVTELQAFMRSYRDQALVNNVLSDMRLFTFISSNWQSGLTNNLESQFIGSAINDLSQMQGDLQNGTMDDAYQLGPAYNLLTASFVGAVKAFGMINPANAYPQSTLDSYLNSAMTVDYSLAGGFLVSYDIFNAGGLSSIVGTQGSKKMWPKYASWWYSSVFGNGYRCDLTAPQNIDNNSFTACQYSGRNFLWSNVSSLPQATLSTVTTQAWNDRWAFAGDQSVAAVLAAMSNLIALNHNAVCDWNTGFYGFGCGHVLLVL